MFASLLLALAPAALVVAAVTDLAERRISNRLTAALALSYPLVALAVGAGFGEIAQGLMIGVGLLAFGFALFAFNIIGGGDAKLIAAVGPWMGFAAFPEFLMFTAFAGGALSAGVLAIRSVQSQMPAGGPVWLTRLFPERAGVPYGVAIAAGGLLAYPQSALVARMFGA
ncbi:MAG: prepilin peptidase [Pseudomonadota bacterium]